ncbi:DJ-1/PfpI family protein [Pseudonocardia sp. HH130630-07]|uniref:DJ-1/PfpI family protein n=1 Tax=Pseudonocardia sp. HH130630-07 TaxID=1690815 RepID=UPI0008152C39|nr:DJ-1/PfpI family protein [Pseudonocardia sp. HH130630-07]ANY09267.1 thiamine biosynthesis protein ThiJ [Pseudonocardia sp. HH130630-07]
MDRIPRTVGLLLFDGFELLDVFGPVELLSRLPDEYTITYLAPDAGPVRSSQGAEVIATASLADPPPSDVVLVPGGSGTRHLATDPAFLERLAAWATPAPLIASVCTGSALLAAAGLLEGYRATSNKRAFDWVTGHGTDVTWVPQARWVHDRDRWTSSGVAAGMDMTAALIGHLSGPEAAATAAREIELEVRTDPDRDPFAVQYGLA